MSRFDRLLAQLTLANQLTLLRIAAIPVFALSLLFGHRELAFWIFAGAAITDLFDGMAARRLGQQTALGAYLDPVADKTLMLVSYVILALPDGVRPFPHFSLEHHVPAWLTILVISRDALIGLVSVGLLLTAGVRRFAPSRLGKWAAALEMVTAGLYLLANVWPPLPSELLFAAGVVTACILVASGVGYLIGIRRKLAAEEREEKG